MSNRLLKSEFLAWMTKQYIKRPKYDLATSGMKSIFEQDLPLDTSNLKLCDYYDGMNLCEPFIKKIAEKEKAPANMILPMPSCSTTNLMLCCHFLSAGDEVIIESPVYEPLQHAAHFTGAKIVTLERRYEEKYQIDIDRLKKLITPKTKLLMMTNLHNPSGVLTSPEKIKEIGELAEKHNFYVHCDEVFLDFMDRNKPLSAPLIHPRFIITCSFSKVYGLGALRIGWIMADPKLLKSLEDIIFLFIPAIPVPMMEIGLRIFDKLEILRDKFRKVIGTNMPIVREWIKTSGVMEWVEPAAGLVSFPRSTVNVDSREVAELLIEKYDTFFVPGNFFGYPKNYRMGIGQPEPELFAQGLKNVTSAIKELAAKK